MKRHLTILLLLGAALAGAGCATTRGSASLSTQELQGRVLHLENLAAQRDQELAMLRDELESERRSRESLEQRLGGKRASTGATTADGSVTIRDIQRALQRAGLDPGPVDGKMGRKTRAAIRSFQEAHGLMADGRIGPQTIAKLKTYMTPATSGEK